MFMNLIIKHCVIEFHINCYQDVQLSFRTMRFVYGGMYYDRRQC